MTETHCKQYSGGALILMKTTALYVNIAAKTIDKLLFQNGSLGDGIYYCPPILWEFSFHVPLLLRYHDSQSNYTMLPNNAADLVVPVYLYCLGCMELGSSEALHGFFQLHSLLPILCSEHVDFQTKVAQTLIVNGGLYQVHNSLNVNGPSSSPTSISSWDKSEHLSSRPSSLILSCK